jgi:3-dehydroquinate synthase
MTADGATRISVTGPPSYDVLIGHGVIDEIPSALAGATRVLLAADERIGAIADKVRAVLVGRGIDVVTHPLPAGEQAKSLSVVEAMWDHLGELHFTRNDGVVAVGGGATTDVAGFAAATWLRGIRVVHVPTTLLAMVDAAIGGKTGINTNAGKNLVGSFHPPAGVIVDLDVLDTLPAPEWVNGMAEVIKAGFIADPAILDIVERDPQDAADPRGKAARELVERSIRVKVDVVSADLREAGPREVLNYGHTLAHAIERVEDYRIAHGHAVSVGMVFVAALARHAGRLDSATADRHRETLHAVGLPVVGRGWRFEDLLEVMRVDKKARGATLRFVVLDAIARPSILEGPDESVLRAAYSEVLPA